MKTAPFALAAFLLAASNVSADNSTTTVENPGDDWSPLGRRVRRRDLVEILGCETPVAGENWDAGISPSWTTSFVNFDNFNSLPDIASPTGTPGGELQLHGAASCKSAPFSGMGSKIEKTFTGLAPGTYSVKTDIRQSINFYSFCQTGAATISELFIDGTAVDNLVTAYGPGCGVATSDETTLSGCVTLAAGDSSFAVALQSYGTDCGAYDARWDDLVISAVDHSVVTYHIWNSATDQEVGLLSNGWVGCIAQPFNLEVRYCSCPPPLVQLKLWSAATGKAVHRQKEVVAPFFLYGDNPATGDVFDNTKPLPNGIYRLYKDDTTYITFTQSCP